MAGFKRAISSRVVEQSKFLKLPPTQQILYMQLCLHADDEGVAEGRMSCLLSGTDDEDLQALEDSNFIKILNDDPVVYILDWEEHTIVRSDRLIPSVYHDLIAKKDEEEPEEEACVKMTPSDVKEDENTKVDNSLTGKDLTPNDTNLRQIDVKCPQNDVKCPQNDAPYHTIQYNTSNQEKKKNIQKEKREVSMTIKSCNNSLSRHFGHSNVETAGLLLEWMRDKDSGTLDSWVKRLKDLSSGKLEIATEIIGKSVRCKYKDFYPVQEQNSPGIAFQNPNNSIVKDRTDQYKNVQDDSISL